jgi:hypothetical protein
MVQSNSLDSLRVNSFLGSIRHEDVVSNHMRECLELKCAEVKPFEELNKELREFN